MNLFGSKKMVIDLNFEHDSAIAFKVAENPDDIPENIDHVLMLYRGPYGLKNTIDMVSIPSSETKEGVVYFEIPLATVINELGLECKTNDSPLKWALLKVENNWNKVSIFHSGYVNPTYGMVDTSLPTYKIRKLLMEND